MIFNLLYSHTNQALLTRYDTNTRQNNFTNINNIIIHNDGLARLPYLITLYYIKLCYVTLCYVMFYYVMLYCIILYFFILCYVMVCYVVILCYVMLQYVMVCCYIILYYINQKLIQLYIKPFKSEPDDGFMKDEAL